MRCLVTTLLLLGTVASAGAMMLAPAPVDDPVTLVALRGRRPVRVVPGVVTVEEYAHHFGAHPRDARRVRAWLRRVGCRVSTLARGALLRCDGRVLRRVPPDLHDVVAELVPVDAPPTVRLKLATEIRPLPTSSTGAFVLTPAEMSRMYGLDVVRNRGIDGSGSTIGIVGLSGIDPAELAVFRRRFDLPPADFVQSTTLRVPGVFEIEAMLDVSWSGALAPGARVVLAVDGLVVGAIAALVDDPSVDILSLSLVICPTNRVSKKLLRQSKRLFRRAKKLGKTVLIASGDDGAMSCGRRRPDPFAVSPHVTGVGGTVPVPVLDADGVAIGLGRDVAWAFSGGGRKRGRRPRWARGVRGRPVPDVAYPADVMYPVFVAGRGIVVGGTSASAPAWAGTVALLNQSLGVPAGFLNAALYQLGRAQADGGAMAFHDVVSGSNGFDVGPGHDLATGWGTPNGAAFFDAYPTP